MSGLIVRDLEVRVAERKLLDGVSFAAPAGALTGLLGPNGAGKSTLLGAVLGLSRPAGGTIGFDGLDLATMPAAARAEITAYVEQSATTTERLTVRDVVALGRLPHQSVWQSGPDRQDEALVERALQLFRLTPFARRLYHTLSGGEQQRVQMARALAQQPRLLLLDEPTSHLDIDGQLQTLQLLRRMARAGTTVLMAMHDLNLALRHCDHLVVLQQGRIAAEGRPVDTLTAELLLEVYGVHARIIALPDGTGPLVVYDQARWGGGDAESGLTMP